MILTNAFWYIFLMVVSSLLFFYTLIKKNNIKLFFLYLFMSGLTYTFEFIILALFKSYRYMPNMLKNIYFDNILGAIVSDAGTVPMTAVFIAAFKLHYFFILLIVGVILSIEHLFLELGIYTHYWWKLAYTGIGLFIAFTIARRFINKLVKNPLKGRIQFLTLYFSYIPIHATIAFILSVFQFFFYSLDWFENPVRSHVVFSTFYIYLTDFFFVTIIYLRLGLLWITTAILSFSIIDFILVNLDILQLSSFWGLGAFFTMRVFLFILLLFMNRILLTRQKI